MGAIEDGGFDVVAARRAAGLLAADAQGGAFGLAGGDAGQHALHLAFVHHGAHGGGGVQRVAGLQRGGVGGHFFHEGVVDAVLHVQARARDADFALVREDGQCGGLRGAVQVGAVVKHDVGRLAAAFQPHALQIGFAGIGHEAFARGGRAREGHAIHIRVTAQRLACHRAQAGHHAEDARGDAGFFGQRRQSDGRQRRLLGRFQDDAVARGQGGRHFPCRHHQRVVPRHYRRHHAQRFAGDGGQRVGAGGCDFVVDLVDGFGVPGVAAGRFRHVECQRVADGLAHVQRFQQRQFFGVLVDQGGQA
ncbi:hypothetical protein D3C72_1303300 [compost metagenome]